MTKKDMEKEKVEREEERIRGVRYKQERERHRRDETWKCRESDSAEVLRIVPVKPEGTNCVRGHSLLCRQDYGTGLLLSCHLLKSGCPSLC